MLASATITTATSVSAMPARKHTEVCLTAPNEHFYSFSESMLQRRTRPCCATLACATSGSCRSVAARAAPVRCSQFRRRFRMMTERTAVKMMHEPAHQQKGELNFAKGALRQSGEGQHKTGWDREHLRNTHQRSSVRLRH